jgi:hypothetical protein
VAALRLEGLRPHGDGRFRPEAELLRAELALVSFDLLQRFGLDGRECGLAVEQPLPVGSASGYEVVTAVKRIKDCLMEKGAWVQGEIQGQKNK